MRSPGAFAAVAATALVLGLTGCSADGGGELSYEDSPLGAYLSSAFGGDLSDEEREKRFEEQNRKQEELVAECMGKEGFEYKPNISTGGVSFSSNDQPWEPDSKEWVEKYGYGIVHNPFSDEAPQEEPTEYVDPNQEYVESLSESEQTAYYATLYGAPSEETLPDDEDGSSYEYRWQDAGCQGWAQHEVQGTEVWQDEQFADLRAKMEKLWSSTQEAPEMRELHSAWAACMADAGEPGFTTQSEAAESISTEQNELYNTMYGEDGGPSDAEMLEDPSKSPEMKKLGEREVELALVDLQCREKTSFTQASLKIQFDIEKRFIEENKAELEAFKAAAEQSS